MVAAVTTAVGKQRKMRLFSSIFKGKTMEHSWVAIARFFGQGSRLWGQRGLGTLYKSVRAIPGMSGHQAVFEAEDDCVFELDVFEPYWAPTLLGGRSYEPELRSVLSRVKHLDPVLVDCGANIGYWSVVATSRQIGLSRVVAIEPNPPTFAQLIRNASLNADRFTCVERAVSSTSGRMVKLAFPEHHAVAQISATDSGGPGVETVSVDDLLRSLDWLGEPTVMKLDVEGHELEVVSGAAAALTFDHLIVVEDFCSSGLRTIRSLLEQGFAIFYADGNGACTWLEDIDHARLCIGRAGKTNRSNNFFASKSTGNLADVLRSWAAQ